LELLFSSYIVQVGQSPEVRRQFADAMGLEPQKFAGLALCAC
jgi:hypothetical protein